MADNKWTRAEAPPPPLFTGKKERDLVKQVNDELIERVIGQTILYYAISREHSDFHPIYGEAINKTFYPPVKVNVLINWEGNKTSTEKFGIDRTSSITVHFHKRRLTEDQNLLVREGDFILYGPSAYEIISLNEPKELFGQAMERFEIEAKCIKTRYNIFNSK